MWSFRDITEQRKKDEQLKYSLEEKELMLREIHHRVKNNLQIISSLLKLQSSHVKDSGTQDYLRISQNRVQSMAIIHEKLYGSKELSSIDFGSYVKQLTTHLLISYGSNPDNIKLNIKAPNVFFDIDTAMPCGLIINELVSNSLKHAFPDNRIGEINIEILTDSSGNVSMSASDNGVGIPDNVDQKISSSLGLQLVNSLIRQLGGELRMIKENGTRFVMKFPPLIYTERK